MKLMSFKDKPGTILDAFDEVTEEHLGTIMVVKLPAVFDVVNLKGPPYRTDLVPVVILKRALPEKHRSHRQPRGSVGLWSNCRVEHVA